jgi:hypothetical protein
MRYSKSGNNRGGVVPQERDRRLLRELALLRIIDREQAKTIAGFGSTTRANARLLALTRAGLLRRFFVATTAGGTKALYAVSREAAELADIPYRGPRRRNDAMLVADSFIHHQLAVNNIYCKLKAEIASHSNAALLRWLTFHEPLTPQLRLIPDGYFELNTSAGIVASFLEVDLGHEHLKVWRKKIQNYLHLAISGDYERIFGQNRFRVLITANSDRRLLGIRNVVRASTGKIFWFTDLASIDQHGMLATVWLRPKGEDRASFISPIL